MGDYRTYQRDLALQHCARLEAENSRLRNTLDAYRDAVRIDVQMDGPKFGGCNASQLRRAWEADRNPLAQSPGAQADMPAAEKGENAKPDLAKQPDIKPAVAALREAQPTQSREERAPCTCHPDDKPPRPCPQKYAYSECVAAEQHEAKPTQSDEEIARELIWRRAWQIYGDATKDDLIEDIAAALAAARQEATAAERERIAAWCDKEAAEWEESGNEFTATFWRGVATAIRAGQP